MKIIDTHQHLWDMDLFPYSWCQTFPALNRSFRIGDYLEAACGLGVEKIRLFHKNALRVYRLD